MEHPNFHKDQFTISANPALLDVPYIHQYLCYESYWAEGIPIAIVQKSIEGSFCFGVYKDAKQVGFARVVSDFATYGYLCDVFIDTAYRGLGLSKWLMEEIMNHPRLQGFRVWMLGTKDAHGLYAQFGFAPHPEPGRIMRKTNPDAYKAKQ